MLAARALVLLFLCFVLCSSLSLTTSKQQQQQQLQGGTSKQQSLSLTASKQQQHQTSKHQPTTKQQQASKHQSLLSLNAASQQQASQHHQQQQHTQDAAAAVARLEGQQTDDLKDREEEVGQHGHRANSQFKLENAMEHYKAAAVATARDPLQLQVGIYDSCHCRGGPSAVLNLNPQGLECFPGFSWWTGQFIQVTECVNDERVIMAIFSDENCQSRTATINSDDMTGDIIFPQPGHCGSAGLQDWNVMYCPTADNPDYPQPTL